MEKIISKSTDEISEFTESVINTVREPLIVLDQDLRVVKASRSFYDFFKVSYNETIGQFIYDLGNRQWDIPKLRELLETILPQQTTFENYEVEHEFSTIGKRIMLLNARQIDRTLGKERIILLAIEDITERKGIENRLEITRKELEVIKIAQDEISEFAEDIINTVREPFLLLDKDLRVVKANGSFYRNFKVSPDETIGALIYDLGNRQWDIPKLRELLETILPEKTTFDHYEVEHVFSIIGKRVMLLNARQIKRALGKEKIILLAIEDVTEHKLAEKDRRYQAGLLESVMEAIIATDAQHRLTAWNLAAKSLYGWTSEEVLGRDGTEILHTEWPLVQAEEMRRKIDETGHWFGEATQVRKDGTRISVEISSLVLRNDSGHIMGYVSANREITERKRIEEELRETNEYLENLFNYANAPIIVWDNSLCITRFNHAFENLSGYKATEVKAQNITILFPKDKIDFSLALIGKTTRGERWESVEIQILRKDNEVRTLLWNSANIFDTKGKVVVSTIAHGIDITERKKQELELINSKEKAESANKLKDAFIANMSHEIRTPLNGILGMSSIIRDTFRNKMEEGDEELFEGINISSNRIIRTVDMILNYSRLQVGEFQLNRKNFNLSSLCTTLVKGFTAIAKLKSLDLSFQNNCGDIVLFADDFSITMAVSNLIDNAIKYTQIGYVTVMLRKEENDDIILDITDTGIGISDEYIKRMFEPYQQEQMGYGRAYEGVGLGLPITKKILDLSGSVLTVKSKKGEGSTFSIKFGKELQPVNKIYETEKFQKVFPLPAKSGIKVVLIVEDDLLNQVTVRKFIENSHRVIVTDSSDKVMEIINREKVDIILMDISIKGKKNGLELTNELKALKEFSHIPVIAVTAHAFEEDKQNALDAGCDNYLSKPFTKESLLNMIALYDHK